MAVGRFITLVLVIICTRRVTSLRKELNKAISFSGFNLRRTLILPGNKKESCTGVFSLIRVNARRLVKKYQLVRLLWVICELLNYALFFRLHKWRSGERL